MSKRRVVRGGSYCNGTWILRAADRVGVVPVIRYWNYGFRIVVRRKP